MDQYQSLSHTKWECKYHIVGIPKCRKNKIYGELRKLLGEIIRESKI
jgi:putative transposase